MDTKTFEIRDRGTFIPALAIRLNPGNEADRFLIARGGFPLSAEVQGKYIVLYKLETNEVSFDCNRWNSSTMLHAHTYIISNWNKLESGAVIDVEHILGRRAEPKVSERFTTPQLGE